MTQLARPKEFNSSDTVRRNPLSHAERAYMHADKWLDLIGLTLTGDIELMPKDLLGVEKIREDQGICDGSAKLVYLINILTKGNRRRARFEYIYQSGISKYVIHVRTDHVDYMVNLTDGMATAFEAGEGNKKVLGYIQLQIKLDDFNLFRSAKGALECY